MKNKKSEISQQLATPKNTIQKLEFLNINLLRNCQNIYKKD